MHSVTSIINNSIESDVSQGSQPVELLLGPYRSGKTAYLVERVIDFCQSKTNLLANSIVVVPSRRYQMLFETRITEALTKRRSDSEVCGLAGLRINTFHEFCRTMLGGLALRYKILPDAIRPALIAQIITDMQNRGELQHLVATSDHIGIHQPVLQLIDEFQSALLLAEDILAKLSGAPPSPIQSRCMELASIYRNYCRALANRGFIDQKQSAYKLIESCAGNKIDNFKLDAFVIDGFDRFSRLQLQVFSEIAKYASQTLLSFDMQIEDNIVAQEYLWKESSYDALMQIFAGISHIKWFNASANKQIATVRKFKAMDSFLEMQEIAGSIKEATAGHIVEPENVLVIMRNVGSYASAIKSAFDNAGVPYFLDNAVALVSLPMVQQILDLSRLAKDDFMPAAVINCLQSPYFNLGLLGISREDVNLLDRIRRDRPMVKGREQWSKMASAQFGAEVEEVALIVNKILSLFDILQPSEPATLSGFVNWLEDIIEKLFLFRFASQDDDPFARWEERKALAEVRRQLATLLYEEIVLGMQAISYDSFLHRLNALLSKSNFRPLPRSKKYVTICGAELAPNRSYKSVYVAGLSEGEFPKRTAGNALTSPDQMAHWRSFGIKFDNPRHNPAFESALFSNIIGRAADTLTFSYPGADFDGEELFPSSFLIDAKGSQAMEELRPFSRALTRPTSVPGFLSAWLWSRGNNLISDSRWQEEFLSLPVSASPIVALSLESLRERIESCQKRLDSRQSVWNGYLVNYVKAGELKIKLPKHWSASRLSDYGKCPFRFWSSHMLHLEPLQELQGKAQENIDPRLIGQAYHKAMELFYEKMNEENLQLFQISKVDLERSQALLSESIDQAIKWLERRDDFQQSEFWQYEQLEIKFRLERFWSKELERAQRDKLAFVPLLVEAAFGDLPVYDQEQKRSYPALLIANGGCSISVRGRIDRIDAAQSAGGQSLDCIRVIDYKSGSSYISKRDAISGRNLQLPLYALAAEQVILPGSKVKQAQYLSITSGESIGSLDFDLNKKEDTDDKDEQKDLRAVTEQNIKRFVERIESGDFLVEPSEKAVCDDCVHKSICRITELE